MFCGAMTDVKRVHKLFICRSCAVEAARQFRLPGDVPDEGQGPEADGRACASVQAARDMVEDEFVRKGWQVDWGTVGQAFDLVAWTQTRTWYVEIVAYRGDEPVSPTGRTLGRLKAAARRWNATPVVAFVRIIDPESVEFRCGNGRRELTTD